MKFLDEIVECRLSDNRRSNANNKAANHVVPLQVFCCSESKRESEREGEWTYLRE